MAGLTESDLIRYSRQILYLGFSEQGQNKLKNARVTVAGLGGLGCAVSIYLACAGIGRITIVDRDLVELSNLNRQILFWDEDVGKEKVFCAASKLTWLNPSVEVIPVFAEITKENTKDIVKGANIVIDAMDNFETRFVLNSACVSEGIPFIHGGVYGLSGEITTIIPGKTACLACIFPEFPKKEEVFPVFGVAPAFIASLQAMEAIKLLAGLGDLLTNKMLYISGETMDFTFVNLAKRPDCPVCGRVS